ncbi:hypothetical protein GGR50DRAFT_691338 [Xylaria sp. CBS 124048]|nr:hypothetical protein GGR50DRAFT_691338 [Xylaria sp. CBS 124048]
MASSAGHIAGSGGAKGQEPGDNPSVAVSDGGQVAASNSTLNTWVGRRRQPSWLVNAMPVPPTPRLTQPAVSTTATSPIEMASFQQPLVLQAQPQSKSQHKPSRSQHQPPPQPGLQCELQPSPHPQLEHELQSQPQLEPQLQTRPHPQPPHQTQRPSPQTQSLPQSPSQLLQLTAPSQPSLLPASRAVTVSGLPPVSTSLADAVLPSPAPSDELSPRLSIFHTISNSGNLFPLSSYKESPAETDHILNGEVTDAQMFSPRTQDAASPASNGPATVQTPTPLTAPPTVEMTLTTPLPPAVVEINNTDTTQRDVSQSSPAKRRRIENPSLEYIQSIGALMKLNSYFEKMVGEQGLDEAVEQPRAVLLKRACLEGDVFYMALHQLFCLWTTEPTLVHGLFYDDLLSTSVADKAFGCLESFLKPNSKLREQVVLWYARFPLPLSALRTDSIYAAAIAQVLRFLLSLSNNWATVMQEHVLLGYPILMSELIKKFYLYSAILQTVMFRSSRRTLGIADRPLGVRLDELFQTDQNKHRNPDGTFRQVDGRPYDLYNKSLAQRYISLIAENKPIPSKMHLNCSTSISPASPASPVTQAAGIPPVVTDQRLAETAGNLWPVTLPSSTGNSVIPSNRDINSPSITSAMAPNTSAGFASPSAVSPVSHALSNGSRNETITPSHHSLNIIQQGQHGVPSPHMLQDVRQRQYEHHRQQLLQQQHAFRQRQLVQQQQQEPQSQNQDYLRYLQQLQLLQQNQQRQQEQSQFQNQQYLQQLQQLQQQRQQPQQQYQLLQAQRPLQPQPQLQLQPQSQLQPQTQLQPQSQQQPQTQQLLPQLLQLQQQHGWQPQHTWQQQQQQQQQLQQYQSPLQQPQHLQPAQQLERQQYEWQHHQIHLRQVQQQQLQKAHAQEIPRPNQPTPHQSVPHQLQYSYGTQPQPRARPNFRISTTPITPTFPNQLGPTHHLSPHSQNANIQPVPVGTLQSPSSVSSPSIFAHRRDSLRSPLTTNQIMPSNVRPSPAPLSRRSSGQTTDRLIPPPGVRISQQDYPHTPYEKRSIDNSLHQAHLRSPRRIPKVESTTAPSERYYQAVKGFVLGPTPITPQAYLYEFTFNLTSATTEKFTSNEKLSGEVLPVNRFSDGSLQLRLRCCYQPMTAEPIADHLWVTLETTWPEHIFMSLNDQVVDLKRKQHHSRDMPADITSLVHPGTNTLNISILPPKTQRQPHSPYLAVEVVEVLSHNSVLRMIQESGRRPASETREVVRRRLARGLSDVSEDDNDLEISGDGLSIDLVDPFVFKIFTIPVRGKTCTHLECFDLENWLKTRLGKRSPCVCGRRPDCKCPKEPSFVDKWKCPLCNRDARPYSLRIDEFLVEVRTHLEQSNQLLTKSITAFADGSWKANDFAEDDCSDNESDENAAQVASKASFKPSVPREIIELDD